MFLGGPVLFGNPGFFGNPVLRGNPVFLGHPCEPARFEHQFRRVLRALWSEHEQSVLVPLGDGSGLAGAAVPEHERGRGRGGAAVAGVRVGRRANHDDSFDNSCLEAGAVCW